MTRRDTLTRTIPTPGRRPASSEDGRGRWALDLVAVRFRSRCRVGFRHLHCVPSCGRLGLREARRQELPTVMLHAYADDSASSTHAVYAALLLPDRLAGEGSLRLRAFKESVDVSVDTELHCRVLFNESARANSPWSAVKLDTVQRALLDLCRALRQISADPVSTRMTFSGATAPPRHGNPSGIVDAIATMGYAALHQALIDKFGADGVRL